MVEDLHLLHESPILGRNCRFLQGPQTEASDIKKIRDAVNSKSEVSACLLNYKKDGSTFINQVRSYSKDFIYSN